MPQPDPNFVPIIFQVMTDDGKEVDYELWLNGAFEITNPLQTLVMKAGAKGQAVLITAGLVPDPTLEMIDDPEDLEPQPEDKEEGIT